MMKLNLTYGLKFKEAITIESAVASFYYINYLKFALAFKIFLLFIMPFYYDLVLSNKLASEIVLYKKGI